MKTWLCVIWLFAGQVLANNILFLGDSHSVGPFGREMDRLLRTAPDAKVGFYGSCGAVGRWFWTGQKTPCGHFYRGVDGVISRGTKGPTPLVTKLMNDILPEVVIVELSGNYTGYSDQFAINDMKKLSQYITAKGAKCFWIGAADSRKGKERLPRLYRLVETAVAQDCEIIDSRPMAKYPATGGDGVHYSGPEGRKEAKKWANQAFQIIRPYL